MSIIVLASASGSPGVTTTALGLSLLWPRDVLLADCDRDPAQAIQAGYLRGADTSGMGLGRAVQAHREGQPLEDVLLTLCVPLAEDDPLTGDDALTAGDYCRRMFLPGFAHPRAPALFTPAWPGLTSAFRQLHHAERDVVVDAGRVGTTGLPAPLLGAADLVLVCLHSTLRSLAAVRLHLPDLLERCGQAGRAEVGLAVVGPQRPYRTSEITARFGVPAVATVDWDPESAAVLSDSGRRPRRFDRTRYARSLRSAALSLYDRLDRAEALVRGGR